VVVVQVVSTHEAGEALGQVEFHLDTRYMTSARVASGDSLRIFRLQKEDYSRILKLYPLDEDVSGLLVLNRRLVLRGKYVDN